MGGFWVMVHFLTKDVLDIFKSHVGVNSWFSLIRIASNSFTIDEKIAWIDIEGVPLKGWTRNTVVKIASKWGSFLYEEDEDAPHFHRKRLCIKTTFNENIFDTFKIIIKGNIFWIRVKEVSGWAPDFSNTTDNFSDSDKESTDDKSNEGLSKKNSEVEEIPESIFEEVEPGEIKFPTQKGTKSNDAHSADPFNLYNLLNNNQPKVTALNQSKVEPRFPPRLAYSTLDLVGETSLLILLLVLRGKWLPNSKNLLIISVYAPQELADKRMLWQYLLHIIEGWNGEVIIIGDCNEVLAAKERFGSIFNVNGAAAFNSFINSGGLVEVPSGGYTFTWALKSAAKMSKLDRFLISEDLMRACPYISSITLDRFLSDHRPILLRELNVDYGPTPFRFYHHWFDLEGFNSFVSSTWNSISIQEPNDEHWIEEPSAVKNEFFSHFKDRFHVPCKNRLFLDMPFPYMLSSDQILDLEKPFSKEEIKGAVWDCGLNKSPGGNASFIALIPKSPEAKMVEDFRSISLISSLYKIITKLLANRLVFVVGELVNEVQSTFIANRQILDGPFILNEIIHWCKAKKKQSMIFKVDFEKAFDSVRWDFLDDIIEKFGFGMRWRDWIQSCLKSSRGSILVNGSPTSEFQFHKGLKQGDPLSPLLFILVMESLHLSFLNVVSAGLFKGISLNSSLKISHFFYADDVVFIGQLSNANIFTIIHVLDCFFRALGLRINLHKSKLIGIVVDSVVVEAASKAIGCLAIKLPFSYLGISIGGYMSRLKAWEDVINKVVLKKLESIRSYFFNGANLNVRKMSFIKWDKVLASKDKGGLGVASFYGLNRALITKWIWRFRSQSNSLLSLVISALHGIDGIDILGFMKKSIGNGEHTNVWEDPWKDNSPLKSLFPRIYSLETNKSISVQMDALHSLLEGAMLSNSSDRWRWTLSGDGKFSVSSIRCFIDDKYLDSVGSKTRWSKCVPIKVNILAWRIKHDLLPTRFNISRRDLFKRIARWWDIILMEVSSYEDWWDWFSNLR
nr:RNA-directed DNA polymerase, eukaryota [Tanacetum cinerariifolium]